ncbi:MAG: hypothetical protein RXN92_01630 [Thermoplasmatales archaeon]
MINGMINTTIIMQLGSRLEVMIVNMDNMEHNFAIVNQSPPYPNMIISECTMG